MANTKYGRSHAQTYEFVQILTKAGIPENQAKAIAEGFTRFDLDNVATKRDIAQVRLEIQKAKADVFKWSVAVLLAQAALIVALVKLI